MSAQPANPNAVSDQVTIEIDGQPMQAPKGSMIIQAADRAGIPIPRFCYHEKLSIAANCRMCLVDVEKMPKPAPACATPVMEGMKIYTQSKRALDSQRNVMEFLLINHPLDCPICDQGGECELQDVAMGYGRSVSRFTERKRVVPDENIGPLVATDMTRCIQCTRCVRFVAEIAGTHELGGLGRGEMLEIGTYIGKSIDSELSGNIIDVCPVGALTNKPFRFRARPWELIARESIGYHDALGSNMFLHTRRGEIMRCVPRDNEAVNESWLSDRDRYSHTGLKSADRAVGALLRDGAKWVEVSLADGIARAAAALKAQAGDRLGVLVHPATSLEEGALLSRIAGALDCGNLDHRLNTLDFADAPVAQPFELPLAEVEQARGILLVGCNPRHEAPLLGHRIRKAWKAGARVAAINPIDFELNFDLAAKSIVPPLAMHDALLALAAAAAEGSAETPPAGMADALGRVEIDDAAREALRTLREADNAVIILGETAIRHPQASRLRALARFIARCTGARCNELPQGANAVGLPTVGVLPKGRNAREMLQSPADAYLLYGVDPAFDFADVPEALMALSAAREVVVFTSFVTDAIRRVASVILPLAVLPESEASLVNVDGRTQTAAAGSKPPGDARPGWRLLRALGEALQLDGFDFVDVAQLRAGVELQDVAAGEGLAEPPAAPDGDGLQRIATTPIYRADAVLRRAAPLAAHPLNRPPCVTLNPEDALARGLGAGSVAHIEDGRGRAALPVVLDRRVARGAAWIETSHDATAPLAATGCSLRVTKVDAHG